MSAALRGGAVAVAPTAIPAVILHRSVQLGHDFATAETICFGNAASIYRHAVPPDDLLSTARVRQSSSHVAG